MSLNLDLNIQFERYVMDICRNEYKPVYEMLLVH